MEPCPLEQPLCTSVSYALQEECTGVAKTDVGWENRKGSECVRAYFAVEEEKNEEVLSCQWKEKCCRYCVLLRVKLRIYPGLKRGQCPSDNIMDAPQVKFWICESSVSILLHLNSPPKAFFCVSVWSCQHHDDLVEQFGLVNITMTLSTSRWPCWASKLKLRDQN